VRMIRDCHHLVACTQTLIVKAALLQPDPADDSIVSDVVSDDKLKKTGMKYKKLQSIAKKLQIKGNESAEVIKNLIVGLRETDPTRFKSLTVTELAQLEAELPTEQVGAAEAPNIDSVVEHEKSFDPSDLCCLRLAIIVSCSCALA